MKTITRDQAIDGIRKKLLALVDDEHSICDVSTRLGIFCGGYTHDSTGALRQRYDWIVRNQPWLKRAEIEDLANRWQLARQRVLGTEIACDTQASGCELHPTCGGWRGMSDEQLAGFHRDFVGEDVEIAPRADLA